VRLLPSNRAISRETVPVLGSKRSNFPETAPMLGNTGAKHIVSARAQVVPAPLLGNIGAKTGCMEPHSS
jgi:hypothetical protein